MLKEYVVKIKGITKQAGSEAKLQGKLDAVLGELLAKFGISYDPAVNESLSSLGLSQVNSDRPDSLFGHVVLDYKEPFLLASPSELSEGKKQIERYLEGVTQEHKRDSENRQRWAGVIWDGAHLAYCHSAGKEWVWSDLYEISEASLLTLVQIYRSLRRKPLTAALLSKVFGKDSDIAGDLLPVMCAHLAKPRHKTKMLFREWRRLFQQVSTYNLDQLPSLKAWAKQNGVATKDASQILFAFHTYYALVVKLLTAELLMAAQQMAQRSLCESIANAADQEAVYSLLNRMEDGKYWRGYRISNFLEGDFFSWYSQERSNTLARGVQQLAREFLDFEPATAVVRPEAIQDLLKQFYSSLIEEQIRHDLGEYYTPDWLAQYLIDLSGYSGKLSESVVLPTKTGHLS